MAALTTVVLEGEALEALLHLLGAAHMDTRGVYRLRVAQDEHGVYLKANEDVWSRPLPASAPVTYAEPEPAPAGHRLGAPVRLADGRWLVACPCGWRREDTLSEVTRAVRAHLAGAEPVVAVAR